ncbi:MAG: 50S ribosomal protein L28 [Bacillota bacterium]
MPRCEICGKTKSVGNRVSHSQIKTKRTYSPNIQRVRAIIDGHTRRVHACTACLRSGKVKRAIRARTVSQD